MTDLILLAESFGCKVQNNLYALWEIQKWFREEKQIYIEPRAYLSFEGGVVFQADVLYMWCETETNDDKTFDSYEGALIDGILDAFAVLKNNPKPK
jgi:hypothetical protein